MDGSVRISNRLKMHNGSGCSDGTAIFNEISDSIPMGIRLLFCLQMRQINIDLFFRRRIAIKYVGIALP